MKSKILVVLGCFLWIALSSCDNTPPLSERIAKVWVAKIVQQGSSVVFQSGATGNDEPGYSSYKLDLSTPPTVRLNEFDGNVFVGNYSLSEDGTTLTLNGLTPEPSDSNGSLEFTISSFADGELVIKANGPYSKTGGTLNTLTLVEGQ